jgi:hypothetical protein
MRASAMVALALAFPKYSDSETSSLLLQELMTRDRVNIRGNLVRLDFILISPVKVKQEA